MSGFAGIIRLEPCADSEQADRSAIERMAQAIAFRGPDFLQTTSQLGASFAFSLLTTGPAPQSHSQPVTIDGAVWLAGDVRLDQRNDLIDGLAQCGQDVRPGVTDEEIVLTAWKLRRQNGVRRIFEQICGDFSFVLWEPRPQELHCFRDVMGVRPFYYCVKDGVLSFSNTLEALHNAPGFSAELDREYIGDFLLHSWCPRPEHTVFKSIRRLPAGHWLAFSPESVQLKKFQGLPIEEPLFLKREEEYVEIYSELLERAVADRLPHGPAAIFLSGGMDSSTIAATACALRRKAGAENDLHAVSADLRPLFDDEEAQWAAKVAEHLGIGIEVIHNGNHAPFSGLRNLGFRFPEPMANPFWSSYVHSHRRVAAKSRVIFIGYGGDDILAGQTGPYFLYLARQGLLRKALMDFGGYVIAKRRAPPLRVGIQNWFRRWLGLEPEPRFPTWLATSFERELGLRNRWLELRHAGPAVHPVHPLGYRGLAGTFWPQALDREDAAYAGLPVRVGLPLFDNALLRFILRLPPLPWCVDKEIVRRAMRGALPETVLTRAKCPLAADPLVLYAQKKGWRLDQTASPSAAVHEFVNWREFLKRGQRRPDGLLWTDLPPIGLNLWLKDIESNKGIQ